MEENTVMTMQEVKSAKTGKKTKPRFIVVREYNGDQSMREAFEQLIERRANTQIDKWLEKKIS